ncbi:MAG: flagellar hook-basal body complex protein FliE [Pirellulaceae bacterium]
MINQINGAPIAPPPMPMPMPQGLAPTPADQPGFKQFLLEALDHVNAAQQQADLAVEQLMTGEEVNPAEVLTAVQKADLTFRMVMQIRNKLVQAYQDIKDIRI